MKIWQKNCDDNTIVIGLSGRFTSDTAEQAAADLTELLNPSCNRKVILDFSEVEYISSAGLRCLLRLQQVQNEEMVLLEVTDEVYDILEMTGMLKLFSVHRKVREISLEGCEVIGVGANATVYRMNSDTILKLCKPGTPLFIPEYECEIAQRAFLDGIPTAISYRNVVRCGESYGIMFELIKSEPLTKLIRNEPQNFETYMTQFVDLLRKLHSVQGDPKYYPSSKQQYRMFLMQSREWYTEEELRKLFYLVDNIPDCGTLVHGDFHPKNIMMSDGRLILIDMISMSYGHPVFDLMSIATMLNMLDNDPSMAENYHEIPAGLLRKICNRFLELYFDISGQEEIDRISGKLKRISLLRDAVLPAISAGLDPGIIRRYVDNCKQFLLPCIGEVLEDIRTL